MSFLSPGFLLAAALAAVATVALHFLVRRQPRSTLFPTARFVPDQAIAAYKRAFHLSDLVILLVRVLILLLVGAALAGPVFRGLRSSVVRVFAADVSGSVASLEEVRDSVAALARKGDVVIAFDTTAREVPAADSLLAARPSADRISGSLSAGLVAAMRAGAALRGRADSVEIVIVSPFLRSELDRATSTIRGAWPGRMRVVPVAPSSAVTGHTTEVVFAGTQRPELAIARNRIDTVGAAIADGNVVVARFERRWRFVPDSLHDAQVVARWVDGEPAAIERDVNGVCTKSILVPVDSSGDMMLRSDFIAFAGALGAPCRSERADTIHATLPFDGRGRLASTTEFPVPSGGNSRASFWLLLMAMALAIIEMILRWSADGRGKNQ